MTFLKNPHQSFPENHTPLTIVKLEKYNPLSFKNFKNVKCACFMNKPLHGPALTIFTQGCQQRHQKAIAGKTCEVPKAPLPQSSLSKFSTVRYSSER